jgi:hypothetical protein
MATYEEAYKELYPLLKGTDAFFVYSDIADDLLDTPQVVELKEYRKNIRALIHNLKMDESNDVTIPDEPSWLDAIKRANRLPTI